MKSQQLIARSPIPQEDLLGCGVACTAFVAQKSYGDIRDYFDDEKVLHLGVYCTDIVRVLEVNNINYSFAKLNDDNMDLIEQDGVIIFISRSKTDPNGHWLVRWHGKYMDPWLNRNERCNLDVKAGLVDELKSKPEWAVYPSCYKEVK